VPTRDDVRSALRRCAERLAQLGTSVAWSSDLVPDLADAGRVYIQLLGAETARRQPAEQRQARGEAVAKLASDDQSLRALRLRIPDLSHQEWIALDERRVCIRAQWRRLFQDFDVVISPPLSIAAYPHDFTSVHAEKTVEGLIEREFGGFQRPPLALTTLNC
jgi:amidase